MCFHDHFRVPLVSPSYYILSLFGSHTHCRAQGRSDARVVRRHTKPKLSTLMLQTDLFDPEAYGRAMYRVEHELGVAREFQYRLVRHWSEALGVVHQLHCEWSGLLQHFIAPVLKMQFHMLTLPVPRVLVVLVKCGRYIVYWMKHL